MHTPHLKKQKTLPVDIKAKQDEIKAAQDDLDGATEKETGVNDFIKGIKKAYEDNTDINKWLEENPIPSFP